MADTEHTDDRVTLLARALNVRDRAESGTVAWDDLDEAGRESYLRDARFVIGALVLIDGKVQ